MESFHCEEETLFWDFYLLLHRSCLDINYYSKEQKCTYPIVYTRLRYENSHVSVI
jgi:hypothetical protein